jgi:hypothetical protein
VIWNRLDDLTSRDKDDEQDDPDTLLAAESSPNVPLLSINTIATGFGLVSGDRAGSGAACLTEVMTDLEGFVQLVVGKTHLNKNEMKSKRQRIRNKSRDWNDSTDLLEALSVSEKVGGVGGSVRALWSGRIAGLVKLRQSEASAMELQKSEASVRVDNAKAAAAGKEKEREREKEERDKVKDKLTPGFWSDRDEDERPDWRMTEDEGDLNSLGRPWGGRVQKKIESWAG